VDTIIKDNALFGFDPNRQPDPNYVPPTRKQKEQRVNPN